MRKQWVIRIRLMAVLVAALVLSQGTALADPAKYVFLFIGDGMGIVQRYAAQAYAGEILLMNALPVQAITATNAADRYITDSAAAGTALASGFKTHVGMLGMTADETPVASIAARARDAGKKVGIVTSVSIDHATPAAFYAHVSNRKMAYDIALDLAASGFDYFGGGGLMDPGNARKKSGRYQGDALDVIKSSGYAVITERDPFLALHGGGRVYARNPRLPDGQALPYAMDSQDIDISLEEFTSKGIDLLDGSAGFFMMVEGGKIDWACHANDAAAAIHEILALDRAVKQAHGFYLRHPEETLIVVTADHETGGMALGASATGYEMFLARLSAQSVSLQAFASDILSEFAIEDAVFDRMKPLITRHLGLVFDGSQGKGAMALEPDDISRLELAFEQSMKNLARVKAGRKGYGFYNGYDPLITELAALLSKQAGIGWTSNKHTGVPVLTTAVGSGAELFSGFLDNTDIARNILRAMGI